MTKHTPGPWHEVQGFAVMSKDGRGIADCRTVDVTDPEERKANARLIAAAPDLLAACKKLLDLWPMGGWMLQAHMETKFIPAVEAAIAKAEGGGP